MQTYRVIVGTDGRVTIPDTRPGETITVQVEHAAEPTERLVNPIPESERPAIAEEVRRLAAEIRIELPEPWRSSDHGDLLYGDDGLPE